MLISKLKQACFRSTLGQTPGRVLSTDNLLVAKPSCPSSPSSHSAVFFCSLSHEKLWHPPPLTPLQHLLSVALWLCKSYVANHSRKVTVREVKFWAPCLL